MNTYRGQEREVKALSSGRLLSSQVAAQLEVAQEQVSAKAGEQPALGGEEPAMALCDHWSNKYSSLCCHLGKSRREVL